MPTVPHINKCIFHHLAPEIGHFPKNLNTTSVLWFVNSLRFENQNREVPHTARLFKIASQRQSCRLNMLNRHDCRRRDVRLGNPSRRHTHTAPIRPDCLRCDGREASDRRQSGGVRRAKCRGSLNWCGRKHRKFTEPGSRDQQNAVSTLKDTGWRKKPRVNSRARSRSADVSKDGGCFPRLTCCSIVNGLPSIDPKLTHEKTQELVMQCIADSACQTTGLVYPATDRNNRGR
ncbi:hypothetical protein LSAT2_022781 [Lamellibrachia satsuma]|nr:hypothetical protein LSAT2_022781 [Lamellibrachia satsuma]